MVTKHIFWIASYPKSGNTLLRSILTALFFSKDGRFDFDLLKKIVSLEEVARLRNVKELVPNSFYNKSMEEKSSLIFNHLYELKKKDNLGFEEDFAFFKTHFCAENYDKKQFLIEEYTRGIIYIVRDPRDVCLSWARYANLSKQKSLDFLLNNNAFIQWTGAHGAPEYPKNIPVFISSWENHFNSWNRNIFSIPYLLIKYEDLVYNKESVIRLLLNFFKKNYNIDVQNKDEKIQNILETTQFSKMQINEKTNGFKESNVDQFFSVGKKNQWHKDLKNEYISIIQEKFGMTMSKLKYDLKVEF